MNMSVANPTYIVQQMGQEQGPYDIILCATRKMTDADGLPLK